jgi:hypothetical protein
MIVGRRGVHRLNIVYDEKEKGFVCFEERN